MNTNDEFDELARQKLAARDFPFQEAHWLEAQRAIAAQRKAQRGGALWYVAGAALVIIGAWLLWPSGEAMTVAEQKVENERSMEANATAPASTTTGTNEVEELGAATNDDAIAHDTQIEGGAGTDVEPAAATKRQTPSRDRVSYPTPRIATATTGDDNAVNPTGDPTSAIQASASSTPAGNVPPANDPPSVDPFGAGTPDVSATNSTTDNTPGNTVNTDPAQPQATDPTVQPSAPQQDAGDAVVVNDTQPVITNDDAGNTSDGEAPTGSQGTTSPEANGGSNVAGTTSVDTTDNVAPPQPQVEPTTNPTPPAPPVVPPLISPRSPWEVSVLGGLFTTTSTYSGGNSSAWSIGKVSDPGFGVEYVHLGSNIGLGGGFHYGTYSDKLTTPEESRSSWTTTPSWYFQPVDTTILIITGSYTDSTGQVIYTGQNVDVTINQLRMSLDSAYASEVIRQASERINRTSYVETVGLVDAHLVQGRWSIGVRGGPTFGLLTTHRGAIPSGEAGYTEFTDLPMKTFVMGWTARAYVRYRFNHAWSVGIEPAMRGQFNDAFEQDGVTRRSTAVGGMLSVSYRLP